MFSLKKTWYKWKEISSFKQFRIQLRVHHTSSTMKLLIVCLLISSVAANLGSLSRITGGTAPKANTIKCMASLNITLGSISRFCGGCLVTPGNVIVTSASCVWNENDGKASSVGIGLGSAKKSDTKIKISEIYKHYAYDLTSNVSTANLAVILLESTVKSTAAIVPIATTLELVADKFVGENLLSCGYGATGNNGARSDKLLCTTLKVVPGVECAPPADRRKRQDAGPAGTICTLNIDDKNACAGDEGGPVFSNKTGTLQFVGVISHFVSSRPNARCQDGHKVAITQLGAWKAFLDDPTVVPS